MITLAHYAAKSHGRSVPNWGNWVARQQLGQKRAMSVLMSPALSDHSALALISGQIGSKKEMRMSTERWILGPDDGTVLFEKLMRVLKQFDFIVDPKWDIADLARFPMCSTVGTILVEAETAEGLVVSGDPTVISKLRDRWGA